MCILIILYVHVCTTDFAQDLKKFNYYYWFAFPALLPEQPIRFDQIATVDVAWNQKQVTQFATLTTFSY